MKISLEWLKDYGLTGLDPTKTADALMAGGFPVEGIEAHGDDAVLDVEVTSNRGDILCHQGTARELAALTGRPFRPIDVEPLQPRESAPFPVTIEDKRLCPHYTARVIKGVKIGPSPAWMVRRLEACGLRAINNVADITNYVMFELGQPLHAFDLSRLERARIIVRNARTGESLVSIDGKERKLAADMLVIADAARPVAVAGVMGGKDSEVTDGTVDVLLESARFDPLSVRKTSRALTLRSDSSYRFERRIDPALPQRASLRATQLILELAGGTLVSYGADGSDDLELRKLTLRLGKLRQLLGIEVNPAEAAEVLQRLGFAPDRSNDAIAVTVPSWRLDVAIEEDLIEEVGRSIGYDRIPVREQIQIRLTPPEPTGQAIETIRDALVSAGYYEALTFTFVSDNLRDDFLPAGAAALPRVDPNTRKDNAHLRPSILPGLLEAVRRNETVGSLDARLFEIGSAFAMDAAGKLSERRVLGLVGSDDVREIRGAVETVLAALDAEKPVVVIPDKQAGFSPAACGRIEWAGQPVGYLGKLDRAIAAKLDLRTLPTVAELDLAALLAGVSTGTATRALAKFPPVKRDLSLVVAEKTRYQHIADLIDALKLPDLEAVEFVTTYRGKPLDPGQKSVTVAMVFRSATTTLTSESVEGAVQGVIAEAKAKLSATLRV